MPRIKKKKGTTRRRQNTKPEVKRGVGGYIWWLLLLVIGVFFYAYFFRTNHWLADEPYNLALQTPDQNQITFLSLDPTTDTVTLLSFPPNLVIQTAYGYGDYKVDSLLKLGQIEGLDDLLLTSSLQQTLGLPVYSLVKLDNSINSNTWQRELKTNLILKSLTSTIPLKDAIKFIRQLNVVRADKIDYIDLAATRLVYEDILRDESRVLKLDLKRLDGFVGSNLSSSAYRANQPTVAIINTTSEPGLASRATRILVNTGVDVVSQSDNLDHLEISKIIINTPQLKDTITTKLLTYFFSPQIEEGSTDSYRADIVLFLGTDYATYLNQKPVK